MTKRKPGYITVSKKGKYKYIQLRKSIAEKNKKTGERVINKKLLFSFGNYKNALNNMLDWRNRPETFPEKLKKQGFDLYDLDDWIMTLETKITKTGRKLDL